MQAERRNLLSLPFPLSDIRTPLGTVILLAGGPGAGKTTLCMHVMQLVLDGVVNGGRYISSEQSIQQVLEVGTRLHKEKIHGELRIRVASDGDQLLEALEDVNHGELVIVDSISQLGISEKTHRLSQHLVAMARAKQCLLILIGQFSKQNEVLGPNKLKHLVDIYAEVIKGKSGYRMLRIPKNRYGAETNTYFGLDADGPTHIDDLFRYAYTVEGEVGNYELLMWPLGNPKWGSLLEYLEENSASLNSEMTRKASAAIESPLYEGRFIEPMDVEERKRFAERHGLEWIGPDNYKEFLDDECEGEG